MTVIGVPQMRRACVRLRGTMPHGDWLPAAEFWRRHRMITLLLWAQIAALVPFGLLEGFTVPGTLFFVAAASVATLIAWRHLGAARAQAEENVRAQSAARRVAEAVAAAAADDELLRLVAAEAAGLLGVERASIARFDADGPVIVAAHPASGVRADRPDGSPAVERVALTGFPARSADGTAVCVPIRSASHLWGGLAATAQTREGLPADAEERLCDLARLVGIGIANERARRELEAQASTDPLTGLANHRAFHERILAEAQRAHRHDRELALVVFDIDHFKRVNDTHGHPVGDEVLVEVARRLREQARLGDVLARVGGEEFAWLMPDASALDAWEAAERARRCIAATPFPTAGSLTASAGTADLAQAGLAGELVRLADQALYWAKRNGRDVTFLYSSEVHEGLDIEEQADRLARAQALQSLRALVQSIDAKHPTTRHHSEGVADLAVAIAGALGWEGDRADELREAGLLHDIGMLTVPDEILLKPGSLTEEEYSRVRTHAAAGAQIAAEVLSAEQVSWIRGHHERHDGLGYPDGLAGSAIPDGAMILALADAWETMTSARPYQSRRSAEDALAECRRCAGRQFTTAAVAALEDLLASGALRAIRGEWSREAAAPR